MAKLIARESEDKPTEETMKISTRTSLITVVDTAQQRKPRPAESGALARQIIMHCTLPKKATSEATLFHNTDRRTGNLIRHQIRNLLAVLFGDLHLTRLLIDL